MKKNLSPVVEFFNSLLKIEEFKLLFKTFILIFILSFCNYAVVFSQTENEISENSEVVFDGLDYYSAEIESYLDPNFPQKPDEENWKFEEQGYKAALKSYSETHPSFPMYNYTGNKEEDQAAYDKACEDWFQNNPYFPQRIDTGHPKEDRERFQKPEESGLHVIQRNIAVCTIWLQAMMNSKVNIHL